MHVLPPTACGSGQHVLRCQGMSCQDGQAVFSKPLKLLPVYVYVVPRSHPALAVGTGHRQTVSWRSCQRWKLVVVIRVYACAVPCFVSYSSHSNGIMTTNLPVSSAVRVDAGCLWHALSSSTAAGYSGQLW